MILVCVHAFGNFVPGDELEVPDGAVFDSAYFEARPASPEADKENNE
jgi:hypothetical protein